MNGKKYYWLKLKRDFFKRHDIRIVEEMPNGKEYILFYLKLLVESVDHEGFLRFNDAIPYNEQMLATITNTNIDIVRKALEYFTQLNMVEIIDDGTIYITEVQKMLGSAVDNDNAIRQQRFRDKKRQENYEIPDSVTKSNASVTQTVTNDNESKSKSIEIELELESKEKIQKKKPFIPPTIDEVAAYCKERNNGVNAKKFVEYYEAGEWKDAKGKPVKNWKQKVITWEKYAGSKISNNRSGGNEFTALLEQMEDAE